MTNTRTGLWFDGVNDHLTTADHAELNWGTAWSLSLWFSFDYDCAIDARIMSRASYADVSLENGNAEGSKVLSLSISTGLKHRLENVRLQPYRLYNLIITLTDDGADCDYVIYVNGKAVDSGTFVGENLAGDVASALYFAIGNDGASNPYKGFISNIFVSEDVLTAAEALTIYASGAGTVDYAAISDHGAEWNIDENAAATCDNETSANIDLTVTNGAVWQTEWDFKGKESGVWDTDDASHNFNGPIFVTEIDWIDATAVDHSAIIKDWAGNIKFEAEADADDFTDRAYPNEWFDGIRIDTLSSGRLLIHVG